MPIQQTANNLQWIPATVRKLIHQEGLVKQEHSAKLQTPANHGKYKNALSEGKNHTFESCRVRHFVRPEGVTVRLMSEL